MKIFDKAAWQIDNGMREDMVIKHFTLLFNWLDEKGFLNNDGKEILDIGVDEEVSLNASLVTKEGATFLDTFYDRMIEQSQYEFSVEQSLLNDYYQQFLQMQKNGF